MHGTRERVATLLAQLRQEFATDSLLNCSEHPSDSIDTKSPISIVVLPPFVYLPQVASALTGSRVEYGAQNVASFSDGAYTGEISATMLADFGCRYALVGHSERRQYFAEPDECLSKKIALLRAQSMTPILCVGETAAERQAGHGQAVVTQQLSAIRDGMAADTSLWQALIIAYEPVWAIGTGLTASPAEAQDMHQLIREFIAAIDETAAKTITLLYGGSVKANNAQALAAQPDIDGMLVGGASLDALEFANIVRAMSKSHAAKLV